MGVKCFTYKTPGGRFKRGEVYDSLSGSRPEKSLLKVHKCSGGRNNTGKITVRYKGGGRKKMMRVIDFKRNKDNVPGVVRTIEYDPLRHAFISLISYVDGVKMYILSPENLSVGDVVMSGDDVTPNVGCCLPLRSIPDGTLVHNVELNPGGGGKIARSAGSFAYVLSKGSDFAIVKLSSGEVRNIDVNCRATIGTVSNKDHFNSTVGKAGGNRHKGIRPRVRGVAMNPVDHPMGGGEGKASGGHPRSRNGIPSRGFRTRKRKKYSSRYILSRG